MWIAPGEKAMGTNFLATCTGALTSGAYTWIMGKHETAWHPENIMYTLALHTVVGILVIFLYTKAFGGFIERQE
jgi:hypothetical protein